MKKSAATVSAAAVLVVALTGCSANGSKAPAEISKPGDNVIQPAHPSQPVPRHHVCLHSPCPW